MSILSVVDRYVQQVLEAGSKMEGRLQQQNTKPTRSNCYNIHLNIPFNNNNVIYHMKINDTLQQYPKHCSYITSQNHKLFESIA